MLLLKNWHTLALDQKFAYALARSAQDRGPRQRGDTPPSHAENLPKETDQDKADFDRFIDRKEWAYDGSKPLQTERDGKTVAGEIQDYRVHKGHRYYRIAPKGKGNPFWVREDLAQPQDKAGKARGRRREALRDTEVTLSDGKGNPYTVASKQLGQIHLAKDYSGNPTIAVGGAEFNFSTQKGAVAVARAFHELLESSPSAKAAIDQGFDHSLVSEPQYLLSRAVLQARGDLSDRDKGMIEASEARVQAYEENLVKPAQQKSAATIPIPRQMPSRPSDRLAQTAPARKEIEALVAGRLSVRRKYAKKGEMP